MMDNASLKVTTLDEESVYSITVLAYDNDLSIPEVFFPCGSTSKLNMAKVCKEIIEQSSFHKPERTIRDSTFAVQNRIGPPFYQSITYFTFDSFDSFDNYEINKILGNEIKGFCLADGDMSFYIYDYELR